MENNKKEIDISKIKIECNAEELKLLSALAMKTVFINIDEKFANQMSLFTAYLTSFIVGKDVYLPIVKNMIEKAKQEQGE